MYKNIKTEEKEEKEAKKTKKVYYNYSRIINGRKYVVKATSLEKAKIKFNNLLNELNDE